MSPLILGDIMARLSAVSFLCFILLTTALFAVPTGSSAQSAASPITVEVADVGKSHELAALLTAKGYTVVVPPKNIWVTDPQNNCTVWIGRNVPLEMLRVVLPEALRFNPYLKFFYLVGDRGEKPPRKVDDTLHIGGSIEAALVKKLNVIDREELLDTLGKVSGIEELHNYLHEKNLAKPPAADKPAS